MKLRIMGTSEEVKQLAELLPAIMRISSVSEEYSNRGSNNVRVYVDGSVEKNPFTQAMQEYAKFKEDKMAILLVAVNSKGQVMETAAATSKKADLILMNFLTSEKFKESVIKLIEKFVEELGMNLEKLEEEEA